MAPKDTWNKARLPFLSQVELLGHMAVALVPLHQTMDLSGSQSVAVEVLLGTEEIDLLRKISFGLSTHARS